MVCYRNRSFCLAYDNEICIAHTCDRAFTVAEHEKARVWWQPMDGSPPVAFVDFSEGCRSIEKPKGKAA